MNRSVLSPWLVLPTLVATACSGSGSSGGPTAPVDFRVSEPGVPGIATEQDPNSAVRLGFSAPVDPNSLGAGSIFLRNPAGIVPATAALVAGQPNVVELRPDRPLAHGAFYRLTATPGLRSQTGAPLAETVEFSLRTRDDRTWGDNEVVQTAALRISHAMVDGRGGIHVLTQSGITPQTSRYSAFDPELGWSAPEILPARAQGLELDPRLGTVCGALVEGVPGSRMLRDHRGWQPPVPIPVQASPRPGLPWPSELFYRWIDGGPTSNALRLGPLVPSSLDSSTHCRVVTAAAAVEFPYPPQEAALAAIAGPGSSAMMLGQRFVVGPEVWARREGEREASALGELPIGATVIHPGLSSNAYGAVCATWGESLIAGSTLISENAAAALYDESTRAWTSATLIPAVSSGSRIIDIASSPAANGDALVAASYELGSAVSVLVLAQHLSPSVPVTPATGAPRIGWIQSGSLSAIDTPGRSFAVTHDVGGHAYVAWLTAVRGRRMTLALRRYDLEAGWQIGFDEVTNSEFLEDVHLVPDGHGNVLLLWIDAGTMMSRWFRAPR